MKKARKPQSFVKQPEYPGGPKALKAFVLQNLKYPHAALVSKTEGVVRLRIYISSKDGKVSKCQIIDSLPNGCDEEAIRVARLLVFKVDVPKGSRISFSKVLNFPFKLPKPTNNLISYSFKKTEKANLIKKNKNAKGNNYGYTIKL